MLHCFWIEGVKRNLQKYFSNGHMNTFNRPQFTPDLFVLEKRKVPLFFHIFPNSSWPVLSAKEIINKKSEGTLEVSPLVQYNNFCALFEAGELHCL